MLLLALLFAAAVVLLGGWRGVFGIVGLGFSLVLLVRFVLPSILEGHDLVAVAVVGAAAVMFVALYLAHGFSVRTSSAVAGTLASLLLIGVLSNFFVDITHLTGLASEEGEFVRALAGSIDMHGLLLGGIVIGSLGVLDDVTVTQASAVWELSLANATYGFRDLYGAVIRIGRDHIASTVNTLVLAYAGASLPLLVLFTLSNRRLGDVLAGEVVAQEIVRRLVGHRSRRLRADHDCRHRGRGDPPPPAHRNGSANVGGLSAPRRTLHATADRHDRCRSGLSPARSRS
jgi:uncharacterized membrane protein